MKKLRTTLMAAATASLLAACGGFFGDDDAAPAEDTTQVPTSATSSTMAWVKFAGGLVASDTAEPLSLDAIPVASLPLSDTEEGSALP